MPYLDIVCILCKRASFCMKYMYDWLTMQTTEEYPTIESAKGVSSTWNNKKKVNWNEFADDLQEQI